MTAKPLDRADFISAIVLIVFALAVIVESLRIDHLEGLDIDPYTAPGLVPGLLGGLLLVCGLALLVRSARRGGWRMTFSAGALPKLLQSEVTRRVGLTLVLTFGFALGLFGRVPFGPGAALFVFVFILLLGPRPRFSDPGWLKQIAIAAAIAICAGYGIAAIFTEIFVVKLP